MVNPKFFADIFVLFFTFDFRTFSISISMLFACFNYNSSNDGQVLKEIFNIVLSTNSQLRLNFINKKVRTFSQFANTMKKIFIKCFGRINFEVKQNAKLPTRLSKICYLCVCLFLYLFVLLF